MAHRAYLFDQEMARLGVRYSAAMGVRDRRRALLVSVPESDAGRVAEVVVRLERR